MCGWGRYCSGSDRRGDGDECSREGGMLEIGLST